MNRSSSKGMGPRGNVSLLGWVGHRVLATVALFGFGMLFAGSASAQSAPTITGQPANTTVNEGQTATFTVTATGSFLSYQWKRDFVDISGANAASYTTPATTSGDNGSKYSVAVFNPWGVVNSTQATLTVNSTPSITSHPSSQSVASGAGVTFSVTATGSSPLSYQWRRDGVDIGGATGSSYNIPSTVPGDNGAKFRCFVSNGFGNALSNEATLTVTGSAPSITSHPASQDLAAGSSATFTVTATGSGPLSYQWRRNGVDIGGATSSSYTINPVVVGDDGATFRCVVTNGFGSDTSNQAVLTVGETPSITTQPSNQSVQVGGSTSFSVVASGSTPLSYQWKKDNVNIGGATSSTYNIASAQLADDGTVYKCDVTNSYGSVTSNNATLTVSNGAPTPTISAPTAGSKYSAGDTIAFSGSATDPEDGALGAAALSWRVDYHGNSGVTTIYPETAGITGDSFTVPTTGENAPTDFYRIYLTATDSSDLTSTTTLDVAPNTANLTLASTPSGAEVSIDGQTVTTPQVIEGVVGFTRSLAAMTQTIGGVSYAFSSWSDGGDATHDITFPATDETIAATFSISGDIPKSGWTLLSVSSEETVGEDGAAANAFDGDPNTLWHTQYTGGDVPHPHSIMIDLGASYEIQGFRYTPRQDASDNGRVDDYEVYVSTDGVNWGSPVHSGFLLDTSEAQQHAFETAVGRYVQFRALSSFDSDPWATVAELDFLQNVSGNGAPNGVITSPTDNVTINVGDTVNFAASASDPEGTAHQPFTYHWEFGAGSGIADYFERNPGDRTYNNPGVFWARFQMADSLGELDPTPSAVKITVLESSGATFLSQSGWTVESVDSEQFGEEAENAFDGDANTIWHTEYNPNQPEPPHDLEIDLGGTFEISGFEYLPRQDGAPNGNIAQYEFYVSLDGSNWGTPVVSGTFPSGAAAQTVYFTATDAAYVRLRAINEVNGQPFTTVAELNIIRPGFGTNTAPDGVIDSPASDVQVAAGGALDLQATASDPDGDTPLTHRWTFMPGSMIIDSTDEDPGVVRFEVPGTYTVTYTVADSRGLVDEVPSVRTVTVLEAQDAISQAGWSLHYVDSEETSAEDGAATNAFDGNTETIWHTEYEQGGPDLLPHEIQIDLGQGYDIGGFQYVPRQDDVNGRIGDFRFYISSDGTNWGAPVVDETFSSTLATKTYTFASKQGRYVRLRALSEINGNEFSSIAELGVLEAPVLTPSVRILTPTSGQLTTNTDLYVLTDASLEAGQGIRLMLDGGTAEGGEQVDIYTAPFETTFVGISMDPHTVEAQVIDAGGAEVDGPGTMDQVDNVGIGDYYVGFGDSITWGDEDDVPEDDSSADGTNQTKGYTPILADLLSAASGRRTMVMNEGVPGSKTLDGVERIADVLQRHPNARCFLVMYGTNDTGVDPLDSGLGLNPGDPGYSGSYKDYMQRIIDEINAAGKTVILAYPPAVKPVGGSRDLLLQELLAVIDELVADPNNNIPIAAVDNYTQFAANAETWYNDPLHPNGEGYQHMADIWFAALGANKDPATVTLTDLTVDYDGTAKSPTVTTSPEGLSVDLVFDAGAGPLPGLPTDAGTYTVDATINDFSYEGSTSGTFTINQAPVTITLSDLEHVYDGTEKSATVTKDPEGVAANVTYNGDAALPIAAGSYDVEVTVTDGNYTGGASGTLEITKAPVTITLTGLNHVYDGTAKSATVTQSPVGVALSVTYNGSATAPTAAGSYTVVASVVDGENYVGSATDTLVIAKAPVTITLSDLDHVYDGTAKSATVTQSPEGVALNVTYDGGSTAPTNAGTYTVQAAVVDTDNYTGSASGTLTINQSPVTVTLSDLVHTFDGSAKTPTVETSPSGVAVNVTYDGSATAPTDSGTYAVVATVADPNFSGSASDTMTILGAGSNVALSNLVQEFDGSPKAPTVTTSPAGLSYSLAYDGSATAPTEAGSYEVVATITDPNFEGSATDTMVIYIAPTISEQPSSSVVAVEGEPITLALAASGSPAVSYQWRKDGVDLAGETGNVLSIASATAGDAGVYTARVSNVGGSVVSSASNVMVYEPIVVSQNPEGQTIQSGSSAVLSITATGPSLTYQWYEGATGNTSAPIGGAIASTFNTEALNITTNYWVRVTSPAETYDSPTVTVAVIASQRLFFGTLTGDLGSFGMIVRADNSALFTAALPTLGACILEETTVNPENGQFSFTADGIGAVSGTINGTTISGTIGSTTFSGTQDDPNGSTEDLAGLYQAVMVNTSNGQVLVIAGSDGSAFVMTEHGEDCSGATTTLGTNGDIDVTLPDGSVVDVTLSSSTSRIEGTLTMDGTTVTVSGAREGVSVTKKLVNMSIRAKVREGADAIMIAGFVISGDGNKRVLLRAVGPTLGDFGVQGTLDDTTIEIFQASASVATNDDWSDADNALDILLTGRALFTFDLPAGSKDSAILIDLPAGSYTAHVKGKDGQVGASLVEVYDADSAAGITPTAQLSNISLRGEAGPGEDTIIAGFVVTGDAPKQLLVRAVGPELTEFGVQGALANPELKLFRQVGAENILIGTNDDWGSDAAVVEAAGEAVFAFPLDEGSASAAMVIWLEPGVYSAHATTAGEAGIGIVEVYEMP